MWGKKSAFRRCQGQIFPRTQSATVIIARTIEFVTAPAATRDNTFFGQKRVREQFAGAFGEAECFGLAEFLRSRCGLCYVFIDDRLIHAVEQPCFSERRIAADHAVE